MPETKGRPTPKRSEARAARRQPVVQATTTRGRSAGRVSPREAMRTGDERNYPAVAAGPERAAVRDAVDARRSFAWLALPGWVAGFGLSLAPNAFAKSLGGLALLFLLVLVVLDSFAAARATGRALDERWPDGTKESRRTLAFYGVVRNTQFRRQRLPKPRVWHSDPVE